MNSRGFSLLEALVAIAIFALIGMAAYTVQSEVIESNQISEQEFNELERLQRAMLVIEQDFRQVVSRQARYEGNEAYQGIIANPNLFESEADGIGFVRAGYYNPRLILPRSTLQPVIYRLQENQLQRLSTPYVDAVIGEEPDVRVLLENIEDFQVRFYGQQMTAEETWQSGPLPRAVEVSITSSQWGRVVRLFAIAESR